MRIVTLAIAAMLACAAGPALAQDSPSAPGAIAPPQDAQTPPAAPAAPAVPAAPSVAPQPAPPTAPSPNPPKAEVPTPRVRRAHRTTVPGARKSRRAKSPSSRNPATAETVPPSPPPPGPPSRYRLQPRRCRLPAPGQSDRAGRVLQPHTAGWVCQAVPEDRAALEKEIARLQDESRRPEVRGRRAARAAAAAAAGRADAAIERPQRGQQAIARRPRARPRGSSRTPGAGWSR